LLEEDADLVAAALSELVLKLSRDRIAAPNRSLSLT